MSDTTPEIPNSFVDQQGQPKPTTPTTPDSSPSLQTQADSKKSWWNNLNPFKKGPGKNPEDASTWREATQLRDGGEPMTTSAEPSAPVVEVPGGMGAGFENVAPAAPTTPTETPHTTTPAEGLKQAA